MPKLFKYNVRYSLIVNGIEYPKTEPFYGRTNDEAEKACEKTLASFNSDGNSYKIHGSDRA